MKSFNAYRPRVAPARLFIVALIALGSNLTQGCKVLTTTKAPANTNVPLTGIIYHLPASMLKMTIESKRDSKNNFSELAVGIGPELIPDKQARFVLTESQNELFSRNHSFTFTNGLLSTVSVEDEGKGGEIAESLASIAMNILSFGALPAGAPAAPAAGSDHDDILPTPEEIIEAFSGMGPGRNEFLHPLTNSVEYFPVPGSGGLVFMRASVEGLPGAKTPQGSPPRSSDLPVPFDGILVRILEPYPAKVTVGIKQHAVYQKRISKYGQIITDQTKSKKTLGEELADVNKRLGTAPNDQMLIDRKKLLEKSISKAEDAIADATVRKSGNEGFLKAVPEREIYAVASQATVIHVPDHSPLVGIPLNRAPLGKTKYALQLDRGVLTAYSANQPSAALEIVKVPLKISEAVVSLPTKILQLRVDYSTKLQALGEQQLKVEKTLADLAKYRNGPTEGEAQIKALEEQKKLLELEKAVAELRAQIAKLSQ